MRTISRIILAHSRTKEGHAAKWYELANWHRGVHPESPYRGERAMKWIDYHYGLEHRGYDYETILGRPVRIPSEHACFGADAIAYVWCGDFANNPPPELMVEEGVQRLADMVAYFGLSPSAILGIHELYPETHGEGGLHLSMRYVRELVKVQRNGP